MYSWWQTQYVSMVADTACIYGGRHSMYLWWQTQYVSLVGLYLDMRGLDAKRIISILLVFR